MTAIGAVGKAYMWANAIEYLRTMDTPNTHAYNACVSACGRGGQHRKALELLREMDEVEGVHADAISYNAAISA